jgi:hypothetical protein
MALGTAPALRSAAPENFSRGRRTKPAIRTADLMIEF